MLKAWIGAALAATACASGADDGTGAPGTDADAGDPTSDTPNDAAPNPPDARITGGHHDASGLDAPYEATIDEPDVGPLGDDGSVVQPMDSGTDSAAPDTSVVVEAGAPDSGQPDATDASPTDYCGGLNEWYAGTTDQEVKHFGEKYTCIVSGWCSQSTSNAVAAYEPGKGWAWNQAWSDSGPCS